MSDDLLNRASRALRDQGQDEPHGPPGARHRVLEAAGRARKAEARQTAAMAAMAVVLMASTAVAAATGHLQQAVAVVKAAVGIAETAAPAQPAASRERRTAAVHPLPREVVPAAMAIEVTPAQVAAQEPEAAVPVVPPPLASGPARAAPHPRRAAAAVDRDLVADDSAAEDQALGLFRTAQRLHAQHEWSAALAAWENYLHLAPRGELAPEARWSRAQCLARLGRLAAARAALKPFASGAEGGYHQADAVELLLALDAAAEPAE